MDDFPSVQPAFESILWRVRATGVEDLEVLHRLSPLERAIYSTRIVEGEVANGGWFQVFFNEVDHLIEPAIEGYELLALPDYAAHFREVRALGFDGDSPEEVGEKLDDAYFRLSGAEAARAAALARRN